MRKEGVPLNNFFSEIIVYINIKTVFIIFCLQKYHAKVEITHTTKFYGVGLPVPVPYRPMFQITYLGLL